MTVTFDAKTLSPLGVAWWTLSHSRTWSHTGTGSDLCVVVPVLVRRPEAVDPTVTVTYGSTALVSAGRVWLNNLPPSERTHAFIEVFAGAVSAGAEDVEVTVSSGTRFSAEYRAVALTYTDVDRVGNLTTAFGAGAGDDMAVTAASLSGRRVVAAFAHEAYPTIEDFSATERDSLDLFLALGEGVAGDAAGAASVTVTASRRDGVPWCGAALDLIEATESGDPLLTGSTPAVEVTEPAPVSTVTIPVLTLAPAFNQMNPKHLRGELFKFPYVAEKVPYMNVPSNTFAAGGVAKLDTYLTRYAGQQILVVAHSMGAQVVAKWLREEGPTSMIDPTEVTFILTGNLERKYNGFPEGGDYPGGESGTGIPAATPYKVIDIARQYDFWADHPDDTDNATAMRNVDPNGSGFGIGSPVHADYSMVSANPDDVRNFSTTEGNITYVWCPTYPAPIIDDQDYFQTVKGVSPRDEVVREDIEAGYSRPVTLPDPPPGGHSGGQFPWGWDSDTSAWVRIPASTADAPSPRTWWLDIEEGS